MKKLMKSKPFSIIPRFQRVGVGYSKNNQGIVFCWLGKVIHLRNPINSR